ncbi:hypothetical protein [Photobacterium leiognathi]|uniref:hypothetical protein n=1 Tax=Photobacterium leiognathi TaxID=553611 RepID=UPI0029829BD4|nr:hypothetical protein [Photobacterium leiognathi]
MSNYIYSINELTISAALKNNIQVLNEINLKGYSLLDIIISSDKFLSDKEIIGKISIETLYFICKNSKPDNLDSFLSTAPKQKRDVIMEALELGVNITNILTQQKLQSELKVRLNK